MGRKFIICCFLLVISITAFGQSLNPSIEVEIFQSAKLTNYEVVNTSQLEFAPISYKEGMIYIQSISKSKKSKEIRFALKYLDGSNNQILLSEISNSNYQIGPCAVSKDNSQIYYSVNHTALPGDDKRIHMKLVRAVNENGKWKEIDDFPFNSYDYSTMHPAWSQDGRYLIFASNMPGGFGKMDLYISRKNNGKWTEPINLGPEVNTSANDWFPNIHRDRYLFFSSDGHEGYGGLDLFLSEYIDNNWQTPKNLGSPMNSSSDDLGFTYSEHDNIGFIASNRSGGKGQDDIYRFELPDNLLKHESPDVIVVEDTRINEEVDIEPSAPVYDPVIDGGLGNKELGTFIFNVQDKETNVSLKAATIKYTPLVSSKDKEGIAKLLSIDNTTGQFTLRKELPGQDDGKNFSLTDVVDGKANVLLLEDQIYLVEISNQGFKKESIVLDASGLAPETSFFLRKDKIELATNPKPASEIVPVPSGLKKNRVLNNVQFGSNNSTLTKRGERELHNIINDLNQYNSSILEISAHTDAIGNASYNLKLSQSRAESAKSYLISKGIPENRIRAKGFGETKIRNHCKEGVVCTDDEHAYNRRIEVKMLEN